MKFVSTASNESAVRGVSWTRFNPHFPGTHWTYRKVTRIHKLQFSDISSILAKSTNCRIVLDNLLMKIRFEWFILFSFVQRSQTRLMTTLPSILGSVKRRKIFQRELTEIVSYNDLCGALLLSIQHHLGNINWRSSCYRLSSLACMRWFCTSTNEFDYFYLTT